MKRVLPLLLLAGCLLPAEERVSLDRAVGKAEVAGISLDVSEGRAAVRSFDGARAELWAQAPVLDITVGIADGSTRPLVLDVLNCMRGSVLTADGVPYDAGSFDNARCQFALDVRDGLRLTIAPPGVSESTPFVFAVLSDVQDAVTKVQDVFGRINRDPELQFIVSTGDLVETGTREELEVFQREMASLRIPLFSTVGNHEMGAPASSWHQLFGLFSVSFDYRGVTYSLVDSGNGTIDPDLYDRLDGWLAAAETRPHVVLTHVPPLDPVGLRGGAFRSRKEAAKFLQKLGAGRVDALFLGHIHSYYAFSAAGVPTYISGGGGAIQERLDGIERHYLRVRASAQGIEDIETFVC